VRARPRSNKDEVDDEDDDVVDDAIRCKVLGETDDDDFRNKTRAMADINIFLELPRATEFAVVVVRNSLLVASKKERRGKVHHRPFLHSSLLLLARESIIQPSSSID